VEKGANTYPIHTTTKEDVNYPVEVKTHSKILSDDLVTNQETSMCE